MNIELTPLKLPDGCTARFFRRQGTCTVVVFNENDELVVKGGRKKVESWLQRRVKGGRLS